MNDRVYIVLYEGYAMPGKRWIYDGLFDTKAAAEDYIEQQKKEYESLRWAKIMVEGPDLRSGINAGSRSQVREILIAPEGEMNEHVYPK